MTTNASVLVIISVAIGFLAGRGYQVAHRAWSDYKKAKALVPQRLKAFWAAVRGAFVILAVALAWMVGSAWAAASSNSTEGPSPSPSPSPSSAAPSHSR
ncbi:hypothetical protein [Micromonospora cremea]|uniref:hypothetical protein n=1 Tax=Micromonospora cremea TaxID=709881 RepID=UPI00117D9E32|nr:hypothetical protein [Micromonospora cremea]